MATESSPDQAWIVRFKPFASTSSQSSHLTSVRALTADQGTHFDVKIGTEFSLPEVSGYIATFDEATKAKLETLPSVYEIEKNQTFKALDLKKQENAPWGLARVSNDGKLTQNGDYTYTYRSDASGKDVTAYVIDTGINEKHVDFEGRAKKGPTFASVRPSDKDLVGHGTHVAGTVGSKTYGVSKNVSIVGIKVFFDPDPRDPCDGVGAYTIDIIRALEWVYQDVISTTPPKKAVVNLSLGGGVSGALDAAVASLVRAGIIVVAAAGNEQVPADYSSPGREPLAITVGATGINDDRADFSNWGRLIDVFAPGVDIESTWIGSDEATKAIQGTSMASPHVAGLVANWLSDTEHEYAGPRVFIQAFLGGAEEALIGNLDLQELKDLNPKYTTVALIAKNKL